MNINGKRNVKNELKDFFFSCVNGVFIVPKLNLKVNILGGR